MSEKRFKTRMEWSNTRVVLLVSPFILIAAAWLALAKGLFNMLGIAVVLTAAAAALALFRDRGKSGIYRIINGVLELKRGNALLIVKPQDIVDASLIERRACRDYVRKRLSQQNKSGYMERKAMEHAFMRFSTVDVGLRSYSFGIGRLFIDRMDTARTDLVLVRMRSGEELVLSPEYNQDLVESIERLKRRQAEAENP